MRPTELLKDEAKKLKKEMRDRTMGYIMTALGLVAGLAWNEAIRESIKIIFPGERNSVLAHFSYAVLITLVVIVIITYLNRYMSREKDQ